MLYQIVFNLVENGIKYNHPGGTVNIRISQSPEHWSLEIQDTGCGIPPDARKSIFQPFYRLDASRSRKLGGAGLGLAIVRSLAEQLGGTIHAADVEPCGTVFTFEAAETIRSLN